MSKDYRLYGEDVRNKEWRLSSTPGDEPFKSSTTFQAAQSIMTEISNILQSREVSSEAMEVVMFDEMAKAVYGSNNIDRVGLGLDETLRICLEIFQGAQGLEFTDRQV
jgi:hypothetical protein